MTIFQSTPLPVLALAPMAGVTDYFFRSLARQYGATLTISEMVASEMCLRRGLHRRNFFAHEPNLSVQILGSDPHIIAEAAQKQVDLGALAIDINMGCPVRKIVRNQSGADLLRDEKRAAAVMEKVVRRVQVPVSVKMRIGWDEQSKNGIHIARIAQESGICSLAVHGRTRSQLYSGRADWEYIAQVVAATHIPVIANGDIRTPEDAALAWHITGAAGLMIGRGALGKPWIFHQIATYLQQGYIPSPPSIQERFALLQNLYPPMLDHYGLPTGHILFRKHLGWYSRSMPDGNNFRATINRSPSLDQTLDLMNSYFQHWLEKESAGELPAIPDVINDDDCALAGE